MTPGAPVEAEQPVPGPGASQRAGLPTAPQRQRHEEAAGPQQVLGLPLGPPHGEVQVLGSSRAGKLVLNSTTR